MAQFIYKHRRGTTQKWQEATSVIPHDGELIVEERTDGRFTVKVGDGIHAFRDLPYVSKALVAKTEFDFNRLIAAENIGETVSYNNTLYLIVEDEEDIKAQVIGPMDKFEYNDLSGRPIEVADLDNITPVANNYYKHNGEDGTKYTVGVIYFYDGKTYKAIDGSGSGGTGGGGGDIEISGIYATGSASELEIDENGLYYSNFGATIADADWNETVIETAFSLPIMAGENVSIDIDNNKFKINAHADSGIDDIAVDGTNFVVTFTDGSQDVTEIDYENTLLATKEDGSTNYITHLNEYGARTSGYEINDDGIQYDIDDVDVTYQDDHEVIITGARKIPIIAGDGINFEVADVVNKDGVQAIKINAEKITSVEDIAEIDTYFTETQNLNADEFGITWTDDFQFIDADDNEFKSGLIYHNAPIAAGNGVEFEKDETHNVFKINATGAGSGSGTTLNKYTLTIKPKDGYTGMNLGSKILLGAKGAVRVFTTSVLNSTGAVPYVVDYWEKYGVGNPRVLLHTGYVNWVSDERDDPSITYHIYRASHDDYTVRKCVYGEDGTIEITNNKYNGAVLTIVYYNDTEITG